MAEIVRYARSLQMEVWAGMKHKFKPEQFPQLDILNGSNFYNPFSDSSYDFLYSLYDELIKTYNPSTFLIGHDEIQGLELYTSGGDMNTAEILAKDISTISNELKARGISTAMWGDMLLDHEKTGSDFRPANSRNTALNSGATHLSIDLLPKDIIILDWHYAFNDDYPSIRHFAGNGLHVLGSSYHLPRAAYSMVRSVEKYKGEGVVGTDWGFWRTLSPAATTLYTQLCGWNTNFNVTKDNKDVLALKSILGNTSTASWSHYLPIPMESVFNETTWDNKIGNHRGVFDLGPMLDLRQLGYGLKSLDDIQFNIACPEEGKNNNCLVLNTGPNGDKLSNILSAGLDLPDVNADAFAFLHTMFIEEPSFSNRKIGKYILEYADGTSVSKYLVEAWNITDVRSSQGLRINNWSFSRGPDVLIGSELAWQAHSNSGIPLNLQMVVWDNPFPEKKIRKIRIIAHKGSESVRIVVLGITILQKG